MQDNQPRTAFLVPPFPALAAEHHVTDCTAATGGVVIDLDAGGEWTLQLYSEDQARALITAAGKAAAMFAAADTFRRQQPEVTAAADCDALEHSI